MPWQPAAVVFPDIELVLPNAIRPLLIDELGLTTPEELATLYVGRAVPNPRLPRMVTFTRDGGDDNGHTDRARVRVRVFDEDDEAATDLARKIPALLQLLVDGDPITSVRKLSGPYDVPDSSGQPQRYLLFETHTRPEGVLT